MEKSLMNIKETVASGYKVVEVNMTDSTESLYAVCTPVKKQ